MFELVPLTTFKIVAATKLASIIFPLMTALPIPAITLLNLLWTVSSAFVLFLNKEMSAIHSNLDVVSPVHFIIEV